ncbi:MAG: hypothetical protein HWE34_05835 [Methylocystaceae bacterium]|nr:hypothetical protein [Methylocystaceae bacterium]
MSDHSKKCTPLFHSGILEANDLLKELPEQLSISQPIKCYYFGETYETYAKLKTKYKDQLDFVNVSPKLNKIAKEISNDVLNLDVFFGSEKFGHALYEASTFGEHNPNLSNLFANICRCKLFMEELEQDYNFVVIVEHTDFGLALSKVAKKHGHHPLLFLKKKNRKPLWLKILRQQLSYFRSAYRDLHEHHKYRKKHPLKINALQNVDVFLMIWARPDSFPEHEKKRSDVYWGQLPKLLQENGLKVGYIASPMNWIFSQTDIQNNADKSQDAIVFVNDCVSLTDLFKGFIGSIIFPFFLSKRTSIANVYMYDVLKFEAINECIKGRILHSIIHNSIGRKFKNLNLKPSIVLHLYEGQGWEKHLRRGLRQYLPDVSIIGCQHAPFAPLYLSFLFSDLDVQKKRLPDILTTIGANDAQTFKTNVKGAIPVYNLGALRYEHLMKIDPSHKKRKNGHFVLCCTSIAYAESLELACKAISATSTIANEKLIINFHPVTDKSFRENLKKDIAEILDCSLAHVEYSEESVQVLIKDAKVILYNSSAAAFDAIAVYIPAIYIGSDTALDFNKVPQSMCNKAQNVTELSYLLDQMEKNEELALTSLKEIQKCFAKPDAESLIDELKSTISVRRLGKLNKISRIYS